MQHKMMLAKLIERARAGEGGRSASMRSLSGMVTEASPDSKQEKDPIFGMATLGGHGNS